MPFGKEVMTVRKEAMCFGTEGMLVRKKTMPLAKQALRLAAKVQKRQYLWQKR